MDNHLSNSINNLSGSSEWNNYFDDEYQSFNGTIRPHWKNVLEKSTTYIITFNLILLMTGMGAATYLKEIILNMKKPWGSIIGMICQFGILPAVGLGLSLYFDLTKYQSVGVLILCCSPGGAFSNFFAYCLGGDIALSILMTATSSLLAFGGMPLNIWLYSQYWVDHEIHIPYINILISMAFATGPALVGMLIRYRTRVWANRITKICSVLGWLGALTSGAFIAAIYWDSFLEVSWNFHIVAILLPAFGFVIAFIVAKILCLNNCIARTIGIETGCQNMVVAMNVMLISFPEPQIRQDMVLFPMEYGVAQLVEVAVLIMAFQCHQFIHRDDVTEEIVKSKIDNTVLMKVPTPCQTITYQRSPTADLLYRQRNWIDNTIETTNSNFSQIAAVPLRKISVTSRCSETSIGSDVSSVKYSYRGFYTDNDERRRKEYDLYATSDSSVVVPLLHRENSVSDSSKDGSTYQPVMPLNDASDVSSRPPVYMQINKNQINRGYRKRKISVLVMENRFESELKEKDSSHTPPRSPSMNEGYGFPTFRTDE